MTTYILGACYMRKVASVIYKRETVGATTVPTESVVKERGRFAFIGGRAQARKPSKECWAGFVVGVSRNDDF